MMARLQKCALLLVALLGIGESAAILLSLLKELQKESQAIGQLASISSQWCTDALHQNQAMAQVLQGQLDDTTTAVQQIKSDEKRLQSESTLAESTQQQREQQLQDATATSKFAATEFASENDQLNKTLEASQNAIRLVKAQMQMDAQQQEQLGSADVVVETLLQTSTDRMTDDEKNVMLSYTSGPKSEQVGAAPARPQDLLRMLVKLHERMGKEQQQTYADHQVMSLRLWSFTDHLNSSIMESKSQAASIGMEMAQRKREHTRLDGKIAALSGLLSKVDSSNIAMTAMCSQDADHKGQIERFVAEESDSVRKSLKQMPTLSSELLFDLSSVLPGNAGITSFLQLKTKGKEPGSDLVDSLSPILKDMGFLAKKFADDSSSFLDAERRVREYRPLQAKVQTHLPKKQAESIADFASSSLQDIYAFLKSDDKTEVITLPSEERMLLNSAGKLKEVTDIYQGLLDHAQTKGKAMDDQLKWCGSIARDAQVDSDAVARSLKWTGAKLNLVHVAMSEYESATDFNKQQQKAIQDRSAQLQKLADVEDSQLQKSYDVLKQYSKQLLSLVSELGMRSGVEESRGVDVVRSLLGKLETHQGLLQQWRGQSKERYQAVASTFKVVQQALGDDAKQSQQRLVRLKVESQVLTSLVSSKAKDKELSENYAKLSKSLCSSSQAQQLQAESSELRQEAAAVQKSLTTLSQPLG